MPAPRPVPHLAVARLAAPIGDLVLASDGLALTGVKVADPGDPAGPPTADPVLLQAASELAEYFAGRRTAFEVPLRIGGTPFEHAVWRYLTTIPHGETRSYAEVAAGIGKPRAARAVGNANNRNPLLIVVPCHRVLTSAGGLAGCAAGKDMRARLIALECGG